MSSEKHLVLVGPMGAGKTTIGRLLAQSLGLPFFDSDREVEAKCGADITWIFDIEGEEGFRERETQALGALLSGPAGVIATGGGIVKMPVNRQLLQSSTALVVYLKTSVATQLERTSTDKGRPLLQQGNPEHTLRRLLSERHPHYQRVAELVVSTDDRLPADVVADILQHRESL